MKLENTKAQMRKGVLELCILSTISEGEIYPSEIIDKLKDSNLIVKQGTIYPLLMRLKNGELLDYTWKESKQGPPRKYYELSDNGKDFLGELDNSWNELVESVNSLNQNI